MKQNSWLSYTCLRSLCLSLACWVVTSPARMRRRREPADSNSNAAQQRRAPTAADIAGDYAIVGTNEDGSPYKGALEVIKHGDVYQFRWDAGKQYDGVGVPNGNVVAVAFTGGSDGEGCGVVSYQVLADGTLEGQWGYWGVNEMRHRKADAHQRFRPGGRLQRHREKS